MKVNKSFIRGNDTVKMRINSELRTQSSKNFLYNLKDKEFDIWANLTYSQFFALNSSYL